MGLKTNSKAVKEKIRKLIIDCYESSTEYYGWDGKELATDYNGICSDILNAFRSEKVNGNLQYKAGRISLQDLFTDWMQGLPTAFNLSDDIFLGNAVDFLGDLLEQSETERNKYTSEKAEVTACYLFYRELTNNAGR